LVLFFKKEHLVFVHFFRWWTAWELQTNNQKTFGPLGAALQRQKPKCAKYFCFFCSQKENSYLLKALFPQP